MRLATITDYAIRLLIYVGQRPDRLCTVTEIATAHGISKAHLTKVTHQLGRRGWLQTVRGKGGGIRLARRPEDINLGLVARDIEPDFQLVPCFAGDDAAHCTLAGNCRLSSILSQALTAFLQQLDKFTLADVLSPVGNPAFANDELPLPHIPLVRVHTGNEHLASK